MMRGGVPLLGWPGELLPRALREGVASGPLVEDEGLAQVLHRLAHVQLALEPCSTQTRRSDMVSPRN